MTSQGRRGLSRYVTQAGRCLIRSDEPRRITEETIFDYMDGAGELYLAYRFGHLDVYVYAAPERALGEIGVERTGCAARTMRSGCCPWIGVASQPT